MSKDMPGTPFRVMRDHDYAGDPTPPTIPWHVAEIAYQGYSQKCGKSQSLERINERGGFYATELDEYCPNWRDLASHISTLSALLKETKEALRNQIEFFKLGNPDHWDIDEWDPADECGAPEWWHYCKSLRATLEKLEKEGF